MLAHLTDLANTAALRLLSQYKPLARLNAVIAGIVAEAQEAEDAFWAMLVQFDLAQAQGVWLDAIGKFVNEPRAGALDDDYRRFIAARILANRSQGSVEDWLNVLRTAIGTIPGYGFVASEVGNLSATLSVPWGVMQFGGLGDRVLLDRLRSLLRGARAAGVNLQLLYQSTQDSDAFVLGDANGHVDPTGKGLDDAQAPGQPNAGALVGAALT